MALSFDQKLRNYAELIVRKGINLRRGQRLHVTCPVEAAALGREVTAAAYRAGAKLVENHWLDDAVILSRFEHADPSTFDEIPTARANSVIQGADRGDAMVSIYAADPDLLKNQDQALVANVQRLTQEYMKGYSAKVMSNRVHWCVVSAPLVAWATRVFPDEPTDAQVPKLWDAIFAAVRADLDDPVAAWDEHLANLLRRRTYLNERQFDALHYTGPGTDFTLGLPENHVWMGGGGKASDGDIFIANMPTEEVFSLPHRGRADGTVRATRPLSYAGTLIDDFSLTFKDGKVVDLKAGKGEDTLRRLIETDEGSARLGEVALVPHSSPISASGILFFNTLFDENASCHLALGRAYPKCMENGPDMSPEEFAAVGGNTSLAHVDFMIGSPDLDIDGLGKDGSVHPVMRGGEWAD